MSIASEYVEFQTESAREAFLDGIEAAGYRFQQHMESYEIFVKGDHAFRVYLDVAGAAA
jgi:glutaredoxin 2